MKLPSNDKVPERASAESLSKIRELQAEVRQLRERELRSRALFDQSDHFMGLTSPDGVLLEANRRALDFIGAKLSDVVGIDFVQTPWWTHDPRLQKRLRDALRSAREGQLVLFEAPQVAAGGRVHAFDFSVRPLLAADGVVTHLAYEGRDVTDRKLAEEKQRASSRMLELVLDTIPVRVFWKDVDGRYLGCNAPFAQDAGVESPEAIIGKSDLALSWQVEAELYRADDRAVMKSGVRRVAYEEPQTRPDGTGLWLRTSKIPLRDNQGHVVGVLGVYEDITASKQAEQRRLDLEVQMQHAQKLESLGVLAGGIAHDFNNLLMAVLGNVDLLRPLTTEQQAVEHLQSLDTAARRARDLCRQLLAYSGRGRFVVQLVDINEVAREMRQLLALSVSKKATLELLLDDALPSIQADATQIRQVMMNLVANASEALVDGEGTIRVRTSRATFGPGILRREGTSEHLPAGTYVLLEVEDTGIGMDARTRARIFEPFFTTKFTGRGLGLAAVVGIVQGHGGIVQVESDVGKGSCFRVFLPSDGRPVVERTIPPPARWRGHGRVLFVDDEPMVLSVVVKLIEHLGFEVDTATHGRGALELYKPEKYVCTILDVTMPHLGGIETMRRMREQDPNVAVVLASGYDAEDVMGRMGDLQADGFLEKPFTMEMLEKTLREVTSGKNAQKARR
ncbi:MAG: PAS domain-containing protein [Myxococcota bacterium]|nr:PAS domain-containing protein [Myxococcota bacterium]